LPECPERFERVPEHDMRKSSALHHTIEGHVMWFAWAVRLECAELAAPADPEAQALRRLLMARAALGCSFDFAFERGAGLAASTRPPMRPHRNASGRVRGSAPSTFRPEPERSGSCFASVSTATQHFRGS
jgi:hypothetical protein